MLAKQTSEVQTLGFIKIDPVLVRPFIIIDLFNNVSKKTSHQWTHTMPTALYDFKVSECSVLKRWLTFLGRLHSYINSLHLWPWGPWNEWTLYIILRWLCVVYTWKALWWLNSPSAFSCLSGAVIINTWNHHSDHRVQPDYHNTAASTDDWQELSLHQEILKLNMYSSSYSKYMYFIYTKWLYKTL